jgi:hypothetical protein
MHVPCHVLELRPVKLRVVGSSNHHQLHQTFVTSIDGRWCSTSINWPSSLLRPIMATKICRNRALTAALRPAKPSIKARNEALSRCIATTSRNNAVPTPKDTINPRAAPRDHIGQLKAPLVNPADKYQSKADDMHKYGAWVMGCLPKYVQQFSVWKDELTIYICPTGTIPVFSFLKCTYSYGDLPRHKLIPQHR